MHAPALRLPGVLREAPGDDLGELPVVRGLGALVGPAASAARLGLADALVDPVETGRTLRENGLQVLSERLPVAPYVAVNRAAFHIRRDEIRAFRRTLGGGA